MVKVQINIVAVVGPTACGKTRLAVKLAERYNGEIISGDSRQVYRGMDIGTGKDLDEYKTGSGKIPYHLIDISDPSEDYNLYRYINDFDSSCKEIIARNKLPILCGGSGLYIEAALRGYELPDIPADPETRIELEETPKDKLITILSQEAPDLYTRTDTSSTRRIIRSIEIARYLKKNNLNSIPQRTSQYYPLIIGVLFPRDEIVKRIDYRLEKRLSEGMVEEVESLIRNGVPLERFLKLGLEYRYCALYLNHEITFDQMKEKLKTEIHRFAKRQMTWFRGMEKRGLSINWINGDDINAASDIIVKIYAGLI